jgi:hypothetical protein
MKSTLNNYSEVGFQQPKTQKWVFCYEMYIIEAQVGGLSTILNVEVNMFVVNWILDQQKLG